MLLSKLFYFQIVCIFLLCVFIMHLIKHLYNYHQIFDFLNLIYLVFLLFLQFQFSKGKDLIFMIFIMIIIFFYWLFVYFYIKIYSSTFIFCQQLSFHLKFIINLLFFEYGFFLFKLIVNLKCLLNLEVFTKLIFYFKKCMICESLEFL